MSNHEIEPTNVHIKVDCGPNHNMDLNTTIPKGTEVVYFTGIAGGAIEGGADASSFLTDLLPNDLSSLPQEAIFHALAGRAQSKVRGG